METLRTLFRLGLTSFRVVDFAPTLPNELEFFCALERLPRSLTRAGARRRAARVVAVLDGASADHSTTERRQWCCRGARFDLVEAKRRAAMAARRLLAKVRRQ